jgi:hypothetical protein
VLRTGDILSGIGRKVISGYLSVLEENITENKKQGNVFISIENCNLWNIETLLKVTNKEQKEEWMAKSKYPAPYQALHSN